MCCHGGVLGHFGWTDARDSRIELSLWKMMSSIIFFTRTPSEWQVIEIARQNTDMARVADPRMVLNCQSFCYGFLSFCILFWDHISSFNETCLFFVLLLFWNQEMLLSKGTLIKYFWSNSNMQSLILKIKSILIAEMTRCLKMTWGDQTILNSYLLKLNHTSYS